MSCRPVPELSLSEYGLSVDDKQAYNLQGIMHIGKETATTLEIVEDLEKIYCGKLAIEYQYLHVRSASFITQNVYQNIIL